MGHEPIFILVPKEKAKNSIEARELVLFKLSELELSQPGRYPFIGGIFSGLLSETCVIEMGPLPYYNKKLRDIVRDNFSKYIPMLKTTIAIGLKVSDIKKDIPELENYTDSDLLDALRLELYTTGLTVSLEIGSSKTGEIVTMYRFRGKELEPPRPIPPSPDKWENGRYKFAELGYEDDAMIVNLCTYHEVIDKEIEKVINIEDIEEKNIIVATAKKKKIIPDNTIDKKWIVILDVLMH